MQLLGQEIPISLEEKVKRLSTPQQAKRVTKGHSYDLGHGPYTTVMVDAYPRFMYEPLGQLALRVQGYGSPLLQIGDGTTQRLEDRLGDSLVGVARLAEQQQERRRRLEDEERHRQAMLRERQEAERRLAEEKERLDALLRDTVSWRRAEDIREYVAALRQLDPDMIDDRAQYCEWALLQADSMDPLRRRSP